MFGDKKKKPTARLIKYPKEEGKYLAHGDDGRVYEATKVNKYMPGGVMFFCYTRRRENLGVHKSAVNQSQKSA